MSRINIRDLNTLKDFERSLQHFNRILEQESDSIEGAWNRLGLDWDDPVHAAFAEMFDEFRPFIKRYLAEARRYESFIHRKIDDAERILGS